MAEQPPLLQLLVAAGQLPLQLVALVVALVPVAVDPVPAAALRPEAGAAAAAPYLATAHWKNLAGGHGPAVCETDSRRSA